MENPEIKRVISVEKIENGWVIKKNVSYLRIPDWPTKEFIGDAKKLKHEISKFFCI